MLLLTKNIFYSDPYTFVPLSCLLEKKPEACYLIDKPFRKGGMLCAFAGIRRDVS